MSIQDDLNTAVGVLTLALAKLAEAYDALSRAMHTAAATGKPTDGYESLSSEIQTLMNFVADEAILTIQKMAEDEAGSRG
jgi:hypothetical protein